MRRLRITAKTKKTVYSHMCAYTHACNEDYGLNAKITFLCTLNISDKILQNVVVSIRLGFSKAAAYCLGDMWRLFSKSALIDLTACRGKLKLSVCFCHTMEISTCNYF